MLDLLLPHVLLEVLSLLLHLVLLISGDAEMLARLSLRAAVRRRAGRKTPSRPGPGRIGRAPARVPLYVLKVYLLFSPRVLRRPCLWPAGQRCFRSLRSLGSGCELLWLCVPRLWAQLDFDVAVRGVEVFHGAEVAVNVHRLFPVCGPCVLYRTKHPVHHFLGPLHGREYVLEVSLAGRRRHWNMAWELVS